METLKDTVIKKRGVKASTWKTYSVLIRELAMKATEKDYENNDFLKDFEKINEILMKMTESKKRLVMSVILVMLNPEGNMRTKQKSTYYDKDEFPEATTSLYKQYLYLKRKNSELFDKELFQQKKSENQEKNWVDWGEILKLQDEFRKKCRRDKINKKTTLTIKEKYWLQQYLVISLYTLILPRRLDYAEMISISKENYEKMTQIEKENGNFIVTQSKIRKFFSFGAKVQKNKNNGTPIYILKVPKALNQVLCLWYKHHTQEGRLLYNKRLQDMTIDGLSKLIIKIMKNGFDGKHITASMLRTICKTDYHKGDRSLLEKLAMAKQMGHTVSCGENFYIKK